MLFHTSTLRRHNAFYDISRKRVRVMSALTRRNQDNAHSPLHSPAAQRCLQSAPELNITMHVPHPWIKPASGRFTMVSRVSFPCPPPSGIWIFLSFKLGTNDTRRIPTAPGKSQTDKIVFLKSFSFISCCELY